jgi:histidinol-phosphate aminotransferase
MANPSVPALPHIAKLHAYTPGLQPTEPGWIKLNTNECPYPPSPRVVHAVREEIGSDGASLRLYPNPKSSPLRAAVAGLHRVREENVLIGNGSDDVLNLLVRAFVGEWRAGSPDPAVSTSPVAGSGDPALHSATAGFTFPSYSLYPVLVGIQDGTSEVIEFDRSMRLPIEKIARSTARAFFLTSPNAPTGVGFSNAEIEQVLQRFSGLLVVDEAYAPFAHESADALLSKYPHLVIVRTLSKAYALAGIRVGYAVGNAQVIDILDRVRDSYNVSRLSQVVALAALSDTSYYADVVAKVRKTRDASIKAFTAASWFTYPSQANFIFTEPKNSRGESGPALAKSAYEFLYQRKVLIRYFPSHALTASFLRISVGTDDEMAVLHELLQEWQKNPPSA